MASTCFDPAPIAELVPHAGRMCLLQSVVMWNAQRIVCSATSHRLTDHPLRAGGRLGVAVGIEYAAQAMAAHGSLLARSQIDPSQGNAVVPTAGFLASARGVRMHVRWLDDLEQVLCVEAERIASDAAAILYGFEVRAAAKLLLEGRASVVLR